MLARRFGHSHYEFDSMWNVGSTEDGLGLKTPMNVYQYFTTLSDAHTYLAVAAGKS